MTLFFIDRHKKSVLYFYIFLVMLFDIFALEI